MYEEYDLRKQGEKASHGSKNESKPKMKEGPAAGTPADEGKTTKGKRKVGKDRAEKSPDDKSSDSIPAKRSYGEAVEIAWVDAQTQNVANELFPPHEKADSSPVMRRARQEAVPTLPSSSTSNDDAEAIRSPSTEQLPLPTGGRNNHNVPAQQGGNLRAPPLDGRTFRHQIMPQDGRVARPHQPSSYLQPPLRNGRVTQPGAFFPPDRYYPTNRPIRYQPHPDAY
ncbi:hypothetical protein CVT26_003867 [Gymnopilus dilepis]|uniref:Uncharacterized protein n=1 Tax=Gymnopilus dilepis TaxID=231916 RepID=A0A409YUX2_9AGAR|nr:hypothetical protein CVT26_003867 [Gymnopilus dilepis]